MGNSHNAVSALHIIALHWSKYTQYPSPGHFAAPFYGVEVYSIVVIIKNASMLTINTWMKMDS